MSAVRIFSDYIKVEFDVDESRKSRSKTKDRSARWRREELHRKLRMLETGER